MLNRMDDYPIHQTPLPVAHPASSDLNVYDRTWFNGYSEDCTRYFGFGTAVYPNRGVLDAHFSVVEAGGRQHCLYASRRAPQERTELTVGPIRYEVVEPLRRARIIIDDNESGIACDLTFSARTSAIPEARQTMWQRQRVVMDATRFAQFGRWTGTVSHPDGEFTVDADSWKGTKDRSWGVRPVGEPTPTGAPVSRGSALFLWAPLQWDDHISHAIFLDAPDSGAAVREGLTSRLYESEHEIPDELDAVADYMVSAQHRLDYDAGTRWLRSAELDLTDTAGATRTITMEPQLRFQFKGLGYSHPVWRQGAWMGELEVAGESFDPSELDPLAPENLHVQHVVKVSDDSGRKGIGALEHKVTGPHAAGGFTAMMDGAT